MTQTVELSVISPVYMAEGNVLELTRRLGSTLAAMKISYEIILVEDGSTDRSWKEIEEAVTRNSAVIGIKLSRNFGQHQAITAGLEAAKGNYAVVMDCDLQDDPTYIPLLYQNARQGSDIVYTFKKERKHGLIKNLLASGFHRFFNLLEKRDEFFSQKEIGNFSIISRKVIDSFLRLKDQHRHYLMVLRWLGFTSSFVEVKHQERFQGKSSYNFSRLLRHAIDGITSQSDRLLHLSIFLGFSIFFLSLAGALYLILLKLIHGTQEGWTSLMVLISLSTGLILISLGTLGIYIGKIFDQAKGRPLYLVDRVSKI